ncbi:DUF3168 domain-containing protein [Sedimentitalea sp. JM2-8]|uniref:DUF3168 domain-containing protein n=1 Tax=Sedimentitalea xiamensis TaxID=3050037 RepID=A0ABT7FCV2_9RHOB|nr:DUF3168 domain-containing protein [Sedimentitalea xiamensis]MDK3072946.1 DUF3168 domain-containing protein [Sedimentitalea xiamensis]
MSYGLANALQTAVYQQLRSDALVSTLVGNAVYDALPVGDVPNLYVTLGPETVRDRSDISGVGAEHRFIISVVTDEAGFGAAKNVAAAVGDALIDADLPLSRGRLVGLWFDRATARRTGKAGRVRRIDLRFRARVEDN